VAVGLKNEAPPCIWGYESRSNDPQWSPQGLESPIPTEETARAKHKQFFAECYLFLLLCVKIKNVVSKPYILTQFTQFLSPTQTPASTNITYLILTTTILALATNPQIFFHTDAAQMLGKMPIDVNEMKIDLMSMSSHKIYGPKGLGAMYVRRRPRVRMDPLMSGGGQERGLRSGTLPHQLCVGFGKGERASERTELVFLRFPPLPPPHTAAHGLMDAAPPSLLLGRSQWTALLTNPLRSV